MATSQRRAYQPVAQGARRLRQIRRPPGGPPLRPVVDRFGRPPRRPGGRGGRPLFRRRAAGATHRTKTSNSNLVHGVMAFAIVVLFLLVGQMGAREPTVVQQGGRGGTVVSGGGGSGAPGADGVDGYSALVVTMDEAPGVNCAPGGLRVDSGLDDGSGGGTARDEILQAGEIALTSYVCDGPAGADGATGANGYNSLVDAQTEAPGGNCAAGGVVVYWGLDNGDGGATANDNILAVSERDGGPKYTCNGEAGANGADGATGAAGRDAGLKYTYSTGTGGDPGSGKFGFDTVTLASIATLRISETDGDSNGIAAFIATWDDSTTTTSRATISVLGDGAPTRVLVFQITSAITDNGAYDSFSVSYVTSSGSHANNDVDKMWFERTGDLGATGSAGSNGAAGQGGGLKYTYSTGTSGDPGSGKFGFDTATLSAIATLRISETDGDGNGIAAFIATWDDSTTTGTRSTVTILGDAAPTRLLVFTITSAITDNGAYDSFSVTYVTSTGSWANNDIDRVFQSRTGDLGATGSAGSNGAGFHAVDSLGSAFTTTSTTGTEVTGLTQSLVSGTYVFTYTLIVRTAATGTGPDFGVNFDSTQTSIIAQMSYQDTGSTASAGTADGTLSGDGAEGIVGGGSTITETTTAPNLNVITGVAGASEDFLVIITGIVMPTATGELELWCATDVNTSQVDIRAGSSLVIVKTG